MMMTSSNSDKILGLHFSNPNLTQSRWISNHVKRLINSTDYGKFLAREVKAGH